MGAVKWGSSDSRMQNSSFQGQKNDMCDEDEEGESGIILYVFFVCACECERVRLGLLQQFEKKRLW
jgi:hypothetical protein